MSSTYLDQLNHAMHNLCRELRIELRPDTPEGQNISSVLSIASTIQSQYERADFRVRLLEGILRRNKIEVPL